MSKSFLRASASSGSERSKLETVFRRGWFPHCGVPLRDFLKGSKRHRRRALEEAITG
jgi:hypothetical protein